MRTAQLVLSHYAVLAIFICASFILGRRLLRRLAFDSAWEAAGFSITLGTGIIAYLVFFLGLVGGLYRWLLGLCLTVLAAAAVLTAPDLFGLSRASFSAWRRLPRRLRAGKESLAMLACLGLAGAAGSLLPLYPPVEWDSIEYHLAASKIYAQSRALVLTEFLRFPVFPQLNEMLFTLMLVFSDDLAAQLVEYLFYLLVAGLLYAYGRRHYSGRVGILAAVLWLSNPIALWAGHVAYVDMGLSLFGLAGMLAFLNYAKTRQTPWLVLAGALLGCAAAVKYPALFWAALCGLYTLWLAYRERGERSWRIPVLFGVATALAACPFYLRNLYYTGSPFFPFLGGFAGQVLWTKADFAGMAADLSRYGVPKTLGSLVQLPWTLMAEPHKFGSNLPAFNAVYLAFLPISLAVGAFQRRLRAILGLALAYTLFWFLTPQVLRYLLPVFPFFCLMSGAAFETILAALLAFTQKIVRAAPGWLTPAGFALVILPVALASCRAAVRTALSQGLPPSTQANRDAYLEERLSSYPAYELLNAARGKNYRLYALFDENMSYFADGVFMGDWFGPARYAPVLHALTDGQKLFDQLRKLNAQYFLFQGSRAGIYRLPDDPVFHEKFKKIYHEKNVQLFELAAP